MEERLSSVEMVIGEMKVELQCLPGLEQAVEHLAQNLARIMVTLDDTQKTMVTMISELDFVRQKSDISDLEDSPTPNEEGTRVRNNGKGVEQGESSEIRKEAERIGIQHDERREWSKYKKLEMPVFSGENPDSWLLLAERYFQIHCLTKEEKLKEVVMSFNGDALSWYRWAETKWHFRDWYDLREQLLLRFRPSQEGTVLEKFLAIKQEGTVAEFRTLFEILAAQLPELTDEVLKSVFMNGLDPIIRAEIRVHKPFGLGPIMEMAQLIEDRNQVIRAHQEKMSIQYPKTVTGNPKAMRRSFDHTQTQVMTIWEPASVEHKDPNIQRLTELELRTRKEKGLCYRRDEKVTVGQSCKNQEPSPYSLSSNLLEDTTQYFA